MRTILISSLIVTSLFLPVLSYPQPYFAEDIGDWKYSDVKIIDPLDTTPTELDIIAVLARINNNLLQVRVDFLDLVLEADYSLHVFIDCQPGGSTDFILDDLQVINFEWDLRLKYSNPDLISIIDSRGKVITTTKVRLYTDIVQDVLEVNIGNLPGILPSSKSRLVLAITDPHSNLVIDSINPFHIKGPSPAPVKVSFEFWNTVDGSTPASLLRSWAGAHTGVQSNRHGLLYLLSAAQKWGMPITLYDLYSPASWSAIDYIGSSLVKDLINANLLYFGSRSCNNGYAQYANSIQELDPVESLLSFKKVVISQYTSLPFSPISIGGDFSDSSLGSPETINALFTYFSEHPWLQLLDGFSETICTSPIVEAPAISIQERTAIPYTSSGSVIPSGLTVAEIQNAIESTMALIPQNILNKLASDTYHNLLLSTQPNVLIARGSYLSQIGHILAAAQWVDNPQVLSSCKLDIDWDGQSECILASDRIFMTFELDGGYLAFAFAQNNFGTHQVIGPSTQFGFIRSDPSILVVERGILGDPGQIFGAFADPLSDWQSYQGKAGSNELTLLSLNGNNVKSFSIHGNEIYVIIDRSQPSVTDMTKIPIMLDPWLKNESNWANLYAEDDCQTQWRWRAGTNISIGISSSVVFNHYSFNDMYFMLNNSEDPNFDYNPGHLLPLTMALIELPVQASIKVKLTIDPECGLNYTTR